MMKFSELTGKQKAVYSVSALALFAVLGPVLGAAAFAAKSMFMFGVWAIGILAVISFWGPINRIFKTMALKLAKANARMNPIETLELDHHNKKTALTAFVNFVVEMIAAHRVSQDELNQLKKEFPNEDLTDRQNMMDMMERAVTKMRSKATEAEAKLDEYGQKIRFIKADNAWAKRATGALTKMKAVEGVDALDELLAGEAIGKVRQNVAEAFAELDMLLDQDDAKMALQITKGNDPKMIEGTTIDVPHFFDKEKAKVKA